NWNDLLAVTYMKGSDPTRYPQRPSTEISVCLLSYPAVSVSPVEHEGDTALSWGQTAAAVSPSLAKARGRARLMRRDRLHAGKYVGLHQRADSFIERPDRLIHLARRVSPRCHTARVGHEVDAAVTQRLLEP